jgi:hypothetical protein
MPSDIEKARELLRRDRKLIEGVLLHKQTSTASDVCGPEWMQAIDTLSAEPEPVSAEQLAEAVSALEPLSPGQVTALETILRNCRERTLREATEAAPEGELREAAAKAGRLADVLEVWLEDATTHFCGIGISMDDPPAIRTVLKALRQRAGCCPECKGLRRDGAWCERWQQDGQQQAEGPGGLVGRRAEFVYESARLEAECSGRPIVPEPWASREQAFRSQFLGVIERLCAEDAPPTTPEAEHESWLRAYQDMGWVYGPQRDPVAKTHPDMVAFDALPEAERQKDAVFLMFCELAKRFIGKQVEQPLAEQVRVPQTNPPTWIGGMPDFDLPTEAEQPDPFLHSAFVEARVREACYVAVMCDRQARDPNAAEVRGDDPCLKAGTRQWRETQLGEAFLGRRPEADPKTCRCRRSVHVGGDEWRYIRKGSFGGDYCVLWAGQQCPDCEETLGNDRPEEDPEFPDCATVQYIGSDKIGTVIGKPRWTYSVSWDGSADTEEVPAHILQAIEREGGANDEGAG